MKNARTGPSSKFLRAKIGCSLTFSSECSWPVCSSFRESLLFSRFLLSVSNHCTLSSNLAKVPCRSLIVASLLSLVASRVPNKPVQEEKKKWICAFTFLLSKFIPVSAHDSLKTLPRDMQKLKIANISCKLLVTLLRQVLKMNIRFKRVCH